MTPQIPIFRNEINALADFKSGVEVARDFAGGKLSGEYSGFGIGALTAVTSDNSVAPLQILSVARVTRPIIDESQLGVVVTNGDPSGASNNTVLGADFQYRNSDWRDGNIVTADFYYQRSFSSTESNDDSFGFAVNYPNEPWRGNVSYKEIGAEFSPALGFVNRKGIREYDGFLGYRWRFRDQYLQTIDFNVNDVLITDLNNQLRSRESRLWVFVSNEHADQIAFNVFRYYENVGTSFELPRSVTVRPGEYDWVNVVGYIDTTMGRPFVFTWENECCSFYDGDYFKTDIALQYRPNYTIEFSPQYVGEFINLPSGYVDIHIFSLNAAVNFTADMRLAVQAQFDTISRNVGLSARYRWEYTPGNELFVGLGQTANVPGTQFRVQTTQLSVRLGQIFRL
jgi:hypothetical protein